MASPAPSYTADQLEVYLQRIGYAESASAAGSTRLQLLQQCIQKDPLAALTEIQQRHLGAIPWGNSSLHYSQHHTVSIHPSCIFEKLVVRKMDGYCMENTNLLFTVLRTLGYRVYPTGGRVSRAAATGNRDAVGYLSIGHMILIVAIDGRKYAIDVGFGNNGPTSPLPLEEDTVAIGIAPGEMRLIKDSIPDFVDQTQRVWIYQIRYNPESEWMPVYSFSENEYLPQDFAVMNFATSNKPTSWFTQAFVCTRVILEEDGFQPKGIYVMIGKEVKRRLGSETEILVTIETEDDRRQALAKYFNMHFQDYEVEGIQGMVSQIR
ncbi:arylamine N-acetyltransferase family protein [Aspergillus clavatus NRRL 1]|uniref:N-acetyltransferase family protein, putative n=2 Tax=Aspergillus clavatus TaxID=5057 RepID=A1CI29_ASPCL|nr:N-acetyltransferase family protein, putative [Aspergillus clavatus NRRL 1]EAW10534.1 N-acetyltransferase family protein, putative [Aspergillus clavatus NRRL 1]CBL43275.1 TPA: arylamine N-acetyltransferase 1 [Aspergillus clavatus]